MSRGANQLKFGHPGVIDPSSVLKALQSVGDGIDGHRAFQYRDPMKTRHSRHFLPTPHRIFQDAPQNCMVAGAVSPRFIDGIMFVYFNRHFSPPVRPLACHVYGAGGGQYCTRSHLGCDCHYSATFETPCSTNGTRALAAGPPPASWSVANSRLQEMSSHQSTATGASVRRAGASDFRKRTCRPLRQFSIAAQGSSRPLQSWE